MVEGIVGMITLLVFIIDKEDTSSVSCWTGKPLLIGCSSDGVC